METTGTATEGEPLKRGEDGPETVKVSHLRTIIFFVTSFLCLTIVFAFSFIIPCPVRPQYLVTWNRTFTKALTYNFLVIEDTSKDKVNDILFILKNTEGSKNNTCAAGMPFPCLFLCAVDGTHGETLWDRPLAPELHWAQCGLEEDTGRNWDCLLSHSDKLTAIDKYTGEIRWQQPHPTGLHSTLPVLSVPDLDGDKVRDVALVASDITQTQLVLLSGKTGVQIGNTAVLDYTRTANHLLHRSPEGSHYVLLQKDTGLYGLALWRIAAKAKAGMEKGLKRDKHWEKNADATSGLVPIYESDSVMKVLRTGETDDSPNLLLVTGKALVLVDGKRLQQLWRVNTSSVLSDPIFGYFNKDSVLDVVVEEDNGNYTKRVFILDGKSGGLLWEVNLLATPNSPGPASIHTTNSFSIFQFWGMMPSTTNTSELVLSERRSYLLHPLYANVLLESPSVTDHIVTFKATLLERGRHAAYILLTGPKDGTPGTVVLSKRKLKQDVPDSRVLRIGAGGSTETNEDIKQAFNRVRFSDW